MGAIRDKEGEIMSEKHAGGRPRMFETVEELDQKIDEYFDGGYDTYTIILKDGKQVEVPAVTLVGLALFLGFCDKQSLYDYQKREEFSCSIKRARAKVEAEYEKQLRFGQPTGAIFALKNFGWKDKQEVDQTVTHIGGKPTEYEED